MVTAEPRDGKLPVIYVKGNHFEVGYQMGDAFKTKIQAFVAESEWVADWQANLDTPKGQELMHTTIRNMKERFPWYMEEIAGISAGSGIPMETIFMFHLDDILSTINDNRERASLAVGCTDVATFVSESNAVLGHTEDTDVAMLNRVYVVVAHIIPSKEMQAKGAKEEQFMALTYPGHMPGYTMGYTQSGIVFTVNTLSPYDLKPGRTPRSFLARAMLGADSISEVLHIFKDEGLGAANGFNMNLFRIDAEDATEQGLFSVEVSPVLEEGAQHSKIVVRRFSNDNERIWHVNKFRWSATPENMGQLQESSDHRAQGIFEHEAPHDVKDIQDILSDKVDRKGFQIYSDVGPIQTVALGIFDTESRTWSLYKFQPNSSEPAVVLPLDFTQK